MSELTKIDFSELQALVIDSLGSIRNEIIEMLKTHELTKIHQINNSQEALELFNEHTPEIVVMNQEFINLAKEIKVADETVARIIYSQTVIIQNSDGNHTLKEQFKNSFHEYIKKSFHEATLRKNNLLGVNTSNKKYTILIVEDDSITQMILQQSLSDANYEIIGVAGNEENALKLYQSKKPDIVLLDMVMEHKDSGLRILQQIGTLENNKIPGAVIMMTSQAESELIVKAFNLGADQYILKSSSEGRVLTGIKNAIAKKKI